MSEELWMEVCNIVKKAVVKTIAKKRKCKKAKWQIAEKRSERQRKKGKIYPFECRVPKYATRDKKAFLSDQCKEIEENNRMGKNSC